MDPEDDKPKQKHGQANMQKKKEMVTSMVEAKKK